MPKKFKGENTKAQDARARKAAVKHAETERKDKAKEDAYWEDNDKHNAKKQQRKASKEGKKLENMNKKKELQEIYEKEMEACKGKSVSQTPQTKVTRSEIKKITENEKQANVKPSDKIKQNVSVQDDLLTKNINQVIAEETSTKDTIEARTVEDAISVLNIDEKLDRHPERRQKAAFNKFEQENMERIKQENPNMRLSQWKQILRREWKKSLDNPMNQSSLAYNAKVDTAKAK